MKALAFTIAFVDERKEQHFIRKAFRTIHANQISADIRFFFDPLALWWFRLETEFNFASL